MFRSLGDYHVRFGFQIPKKVVPLVFELDSVTAVGLCRIVSYEKGLLRFEQEEETVNWNLVTGERTVENIPWNGRSLWGFPVMGDLHQYVLEREIVSNITPKPFSPTTLLFVAFGIGTKKKPEIAVEEERRAAFILRDEKTLSDGVFVFDNEWYGVSEKGITHLASGTLIFRERIRSVSGLFCIGNVLHIFTSDSYTRYRIHKA